MMLDFIGKYFLYGDVHTRLDYIIFLAIVIFMYLWGVFAWVVREDDHMNNWYNNAYMLGFKFAIFTIFLIWLFIGESTSWSTKLQLWLTSPV